MSSTKKFNQGGCVWDDGVVRATEGDILDPESLGAGPVLGWGIGVFSDSEEVVEGNVNQVPNSLAFGVWTGKPCKDQVMGHSDGHSKFGLWCWVLPAVALNLLL